MDNSLEKLLQKTLELEGLVALALKRGEDTPDMVLAMIRDKANAVASSANAIATATTSALPKSTEEASAEPEPNKSAESVVESIDTLPDDEPDDDITVELVDEPEEENSSEELSETETAENISEAEKPSVETPAVSAQQESTDATSSDNQDLLATNEDEASEDEEENESDLTLDEALQRDMTKDLRHAFSLNDRYRYRRELFGNSDSVMNETLNLVETMHSFDEAEDYFYNDLQWEHDSPEVADFMVIIKNHFWNKRQQV